MSARRIDAVQKAIESSQNVEALLGYTFTIATETIRNKEFKTKVLRMILLIYQRRQSSIGSNFDFYKIAKCQFHLGLPDNTASLCEKLIASDDYLTSYQIAFDLVDKEQQSFTTAVINQV
jgi:26S proteasome regulatory subunit N2